VGQFLPFFAEFDQMPFSVADFKELHVAPIAARFRIVGQGGSYMWDELAAAAWIDPKLITRKETRYMTVDIDHGAAYGNTLTWTDKDNPKLVRKSSWIRIWQDLTRCLW
jgi:inosine-uridine nucleoside N-ribohydrolase